MGSLQWFVLVFVVFIFLFKRFVKLFHLQFLIFTCSIFSFLYRLLLYALNLFFTHKLKIEVRLGHVSLLPPSVQNTYFFFKNFTVVSTHLCVFFYEFAVLTFVLQHIDKVRLTSSLVNADTKRLLGLLIEDVRFTRDCSVPTTTSFPAAPNHVQSEASRNNLLERLLPILTSFVQVYFRPIYCYFDN